MDWVAVGLGKDIPAGVVVPVCLAGVDLAVWRSDTGRINAWDDRCPHRGMRLSHGFVRGDALNCIYHGWRYREDGTCGHIPAHPSLTPPATICVPRHACTESDGVIWVSRTEGTGAPPQLDGLVPQRSLPVDLPAKTVARLCGGATDGIVTLNTERRITAALQPGSGNQCMIHVLAEPSAEPVRVSRWLEDWRAELEGVTA